MITFTTALVLLVLGYVVYGAFVERVFGADASRKTPCYTMADGVDYTPMPTWKVYLIQFLNINKQIHVVISLCCNIKS